MRLYTEYKHTSASFDLRILPLRTTRAGLRVRVLQLSARHGDPEEGQRAGGGEGERLQWQQ